MYFKINTRSSAEVVRFLQKTGIAYELSSSVIPFAVKDEVEKFSRDIVMNRIDEDLRKYYERPLSEAPMLTPEELLDRARELDLYMAKPLEKLHRHIPEMIREESLTKGIRQVIETSWNEMTK